MASGEQSSADLNQKTHRTGRNDEGDRESAEPSLRPISGKWDQEITQEGSDMSENTHVRFPVCCARVALVSSGAGVDAAPRTRRLKNAQNPLRKFKRERSVRWNI